MCILPDWQIIQWAKNGGITPFEIDHVNPASIDLTWSGRVRLAMKQRDGVERPAWHTVVKCEIMEMKPGTFYLLDTTEYIRLPANISASLYLKSSMGRLGLEHLHAGWVDPGFEGTLTLEMEVRAPWNVTLEKGQRIMQLVLSTMAGTPDTPYNGRYLGQTEPTGARSVK